MAGSWHKLLGNIKLQLKVEFKSHFISIKIQIPDIQRLTYSVKSNDQLTVMA